MSAGAFVRARVIYIASSSASSYRRASAATGVATHPSGSRAFLRGAHNRTRAFSGSKPIFEPTSYSSQLPAASMPLVSNHDGTTLDIEPHGIEPPFPLGRLMCPRLGLGQGRPDFRPPRDGHSLSSFNPRFLD
jgi:hypothetical protein